ncbi:MAG: NAD(P)/FAD-dependent oxidoreductase [Actinomycetota bacterium]|nr:NAD(P)/FAD-dependent oxidoreductase [Actinomycetota bacterium]
MASRDLDAVVVGSGPNGLAAAVTLARAGRSVLVLEAADAAGGGLRSAELTLPGFVHDVCSAVHPLAAASPFFQEVPLAEHGLELVQPPVPLAHALDDGGAVLLERSLEATAAGLRGDAEAWRRLLVPLVRDARVLLAETLRPLRVPRHPVKLGLFGLRALRSATALADALFAGERAKALFAGSAAHSMLPLTRSPSAAFGLVLSLLGHVVGWPLARGGSQRIADALVSELRAHGGEVETRRRLNSLAELPRARAVLCDLTPRELLRVGGERFPPRYRSALRRYRYGPGAFKVDYALAGPVPWAAPECSRAGTLHLGGVLREVVASEETASRGLHAERPFVIAAQPSLFDPTRAPAGRHTFWAYCHVPNGSTVDMTEPIEAQIERFAPGFRERVLARVSTSPAEFERHSPNFVGGDINGGLADLRQVIARPVARLVPYATPVPGLYVCSSATPPGGGVHGMSGYLAAQVALGTTLR